MQNNIFAYWEYDSIQGKPRRELTTLGAALAFLIAVPVASVVIYGIIVLIPVIQNRL